ncbi:hypothetical protein [Larsenimonas suaedae]|uniref:DUF2384 domain-containing protein n=1 Tax=Larsenimonas suaedae TaxID=1851019 RepID=A0ABU1GX32_9GAMM|nr:hypothetical protein [Larsenimonas suaedae]MCM2973169.1 hypothetical protein [Larsenimonas suaedae]MDR5896606.1 hypothetical protein [Larsenimonas suaedae]
MTDAQTPQFYHSAMQGLSHLVGHWLRIGDASADRLAIILADTARLTKLGQPEDNPTGEQLKAWSQGETPPLWAAKAALFLITQMPQRPVPTTDVECAAWAYTWLRIRSYQSVAAAMNPLPAHLHPLLEAALDTAWGDLHSQRLI